MMMSKLVALIAATLLSLNSWHMDLQASPAVSQVIKLSLDKNAPDYISSQTSPILVPQSFAPDGKLNLVTVWKGDVSGVGAVAILYFLPRTKAIADSKLHAQVTDIWHRFCPSIRQSKLDLVIIRAIDPNFMKTYSYIFLKDSNGRWARNHDGNYVDRVIKLLWDVPQS